MNWTKFFQALIQSEEPLVPVFAHDAESNAIAGIVLVAEATVGVILDQLKVKVPAPITPAPAVPAPTPVPAAA